MDHYYIDDLLDVDSEEYEDLTNDYIDLDGIDLPSFHEQHNGMMAYRRANDLNIMEELSNLASNCMITVFWQSFGDIKQLLFVCLCFRLISFSINQFCVKYNNTIDAKHSLSFIFGVYILHGMFNDIFFQFVTFLFLLAITAYIFHHILPSRKNSGIFISLGTVFLILITEMLYSNPTVWNRIRGILLLMSMKIISVLIDCDRKKRTSFPSMMEYLGYCFHPGTVAFGPWISLQQYVDSLCANHPLNFNWILCCFKSLLQTFLCLFLSDCICSYLFINESNVFSPAIFPIVANQWILSYESAISFHFSHYYVSYLAVTTCLLSGVGATTEPLKKEKTDDDYKVLSNDAPFKQKIVWSEFKIAKPLSVEIPRSMLNVVVAWNVPMSKWLKTYVFDSSRALGDFSAILFTYVASAMLHGLSFHLACILLSLAFYTYVEHVLRKKLSLIFNCPSIQARPKSSDDTTNASVWTHLFNFTWILINIMHLAYLGSMFQDENDESGSGGYSSHYTLAKWSQLGYASHIFAFTCFVINCLI